MRPAPLVALAALIALPASAGEAELAVALTPSFATSSYRDAQHLGAAGSVDLWLGLSELAWLSFSLGGGYADRFAAAASVGAVLALDVLSVVPWVDLSLEGLYADEQLWPGLRVGLGAEYFVTSSFTVGIAGYGNPGIGESPSFLRAGLRFALRQDL